MRVSDDAVVLLAVCLGSRDRAACVMSWRGWKVEAYEFWAVGRDAMGVWVALILVSASVVFVWCGVELLR